MGLRTYLVTSAPGHGCRVPAWCAVTAFDADDAVELVRSVYAPDDLLPLSVEVEDLSPKEIQSRIGNSDFGVPVLRGIWYPHVDDP